MDNNKTKGLVVQGQHMIQYPKRINALGFRGCHLVRGWSEIKFEQFKFEKVEGCFKGSRDWF